MKKNNCLYCYKPVEEGEFHSACSLKFFGTTNPPEIPYSLTDMATLAKQVVQRSISVPGVQPKISMTIGNEKHNNRLTVVGIPDGKYIFKPPSDIYPEMPANEHLTMKIAETSGIRVVPSSLIRLKSGELSYLTKRIDRTEKGAKIHMLDMFQITEAFDKYKSSMEKIGKAIHEHSGNTLLDKVLFFELALFSFLTGNSDMHLKNFSMIEAPAGWVLAPAYDLLNVAIANPEDTEELALTVDGRKKKIKRDNFINLGKSLQLTDKQIDRAFERLSKTVKIATDLTSRSFLSFKMQKAYLDVVERRFKAIN
ncbi:MAG TPA: HipA domain-containing protein [Prolixibacteraceae bacterium]|nr:HipA domain-containing protein [Prolixibacteraceae bacterium]